MTLWTIQTLEVWSEIQKRGRFVCDSTAPEFLGNYMSCRDSYDWLVCEMERRLGKRPEGVEYPIWAWHTRDWKRKKPDLRESGYGTKGAKYVCMEIEIPDREVVLTDFDIWHYVLNDWYFCASSSEEEWRKKMELFDRLPIEKQEEEKRSSWQNVFDIASLENDWEQRGRYIQATFWCLTLDEIKKVQIFTAR